MKTEIRYFTDPLCSWSWALEPQWRRLRYEYGDLLSCRYVMGGLIADWETYQDPLNAVSRPAHLAPQWYMASRASGMPIDETIWLEDPPASSYPACAAVKAAEAQGPEAAEALLRRLREAVMLERRNVSRREVLLELASHLSEAAPVLGFDADRFAQDLGSPQALEAFKTDLKEARYLGIGRYPTLLFRGPSGRRAVTGWVPYERLQEVLELVSPGLPSRPARSAEEYRQAWGGALEVEVAEALRPLQ